MQRLVCWADKILINTLWLYYLAVEFGRSGKDIVWWLHESEGLWRHDKDILRYILEQPNIRVYAVSNVVKKVVEDGIGIRNKVEVLSFGLPEYPIDDRREDGKKVFAIIGGICHNKGQDIFIDAIEKLPQQCRQSSEFWIVGKGILQQEELEKANRYPCIKICGEIDNREIKDIYSQIDVVVCCSREEGMSITVIEGFMNRKITIVTEIAGVAKFVKDGVNGFIMKNEDSDHLAEIMQSIIKSPERFECIGNEARKTFDRFFSMEVFRPKLIKVFE
jgi:glycosyltransferase involved in cell wall biosynthesis